MAFEHNLSRLHVIDRVDVEDGVALLKVRSRQPSETTRKQSKAAKPTQPGGVLQASTTDSAPEGLRVNK